MMREEALTMLSWCFASVSREEWEDATGADMWPTLVEYLRGEAEPSNKLNTALERLVAPPTYGEKASFAARHFTGGLPESLLPVESLYTQSGAGLPDLREYLREPALYMRELAASLGLEIPTAFAAYPDHLSVELDMAAFLYATNPDHAHDFMVHRFTWLPRYAAKLQSVNADASFYAAVIETLLCVFNAWRKER